MNRNNDKPAWQFHNATSTVLVPDGLPPDQALQRITHLGVGAHQDDLEFMAFQGIVECYHSKDRHFGAVTCTNGSGSARTGAYASFTDQDMMAVRRREQNAAAVCGRYGVMIQLDYPSRVVKNPAQIELVEDLKQILSVAQPGVVYTHNPADKHDTHVGVVLALLQAARELPADRRPDRVIGCEVWRGLDWLPDAEKVLMDVSGHDHLAAALDGVFDSQIAGGKRYDLATLGRRAANATFFESHETDRSTQLIFGMDLTPLAADPSLDIVEFVCGFIDRFRQDVRNRLARRLGKA